MSQFGPVCPFMLLGHVPVCDPPNNSPEDADCAENVEHCPPTPGRYDCHSEGRHDSRAQTARTMSDALDNATLSPRKPHLHRACCCGKCSSFSYTEKETNDRERKHSDAVGGCCRHDGPICHDGTQHGSRPELVAQPAARDLEYGIAPRKHAENNSHGDLIKAEFLADDRCCSGDIHAVHVGY